MSIPGASARCRAIIPLSAYPAAVTESDFELFRDPVSGLALPRVYPSGRPALSRKRKWRIVSSYIEDCDCSRLSHIASSGSSRFVLQLIASLNHTASPLSRFDTPISGSHLTSAATSKPPTPYA